MYGALTCTAHPTFVRPQIKCMRILQQFPLADDPSLAGAVSAVLQRIIAVCVLPMPLASAPLYSCRAAETARSRDREEHQQEQCFASGACAIALCHTPRHSDASKSAQVLFEAVGLVILLERDRELVEQMAVQLGRFIAAKEPNTRRVTYAPLDNTPQLTRRCVGAAILAWRTWAGCPCCPKWRL